MSSEVFRRVGRGGAGNWYSQKDIEDAEKDKIEDLEAQKPSDSAANQASAVGGGSYSRGGRGGAGNFYDPALAAESRQMEKQEGERIKAAVDANLAKPRAGLSGRGGMGNWADKSALTAQAEQEEKKKREDIEARIMQDVAAGLAMPAPAYHHQGREQDE